MNTILAIQNTYHEVQIALINNNLILEQSDIDKKQASKLLIVRLKQLLEKQNLSLNEIPFISVNQGPGPFTTLRVVIASVNGLSFAQHTPLVGVDAFDAMLAEWHNPRYPTTIVLFNAFSQDVYVAIEQPEKPTRKGYNNINALLAKCIDLPGPIRFIGNGTELHYQKIKDIFGEQAYIPEPLPIYCSIAQIARIGHQQWKENKKGTEQLLPLYLKKHPAEQQLIKGPPG